MPLPLIAVAGYGTAALVAATIAALHAGKVVSPRIAEWDIAPVVWLHPDLEKDLAGPLVEACVRITDVGHELSPASGQVHPQPTNPMGCILILPRPLDRVKALALAHVSAEFEEDQPSSMPEPSEDDHEVDAPEGIIRSAIIYVDPVEMYGKDKARILAHELMHTLGYLHCTARLGRKHAEHHHVVLQIPKRGHLMNPFYDEGGWNMAGLEADAVGDPKERKKKRKS